MHVWCLPGEDLATECTMRRRQAREDLSMHMFCWEILYHLPERCYRASFSLSWKWYCLMAVARGLVACPDGSAPVLTKKGGLLSIRQV